MSAPAPIITPADIPGPRPTTVLRYGTPAPTSSSTAGVAALRRGAALTELLPATPSEALTMTALTEVLDAATAVVDGRGTAGTMARLKALEAALDELAATDAGLAVVLAAALMVDRYGRAGAPEYLAQLEAAVAAQREGGAS
jgi:hypothetical protein